MVGKIKQKSKTIFVSIMVPLILVSLFQFVLFFVSFSVGGIYKGMKKNSLDIFSERVTNRKLDIESDIIHRWSNMADVQENINEIVSNQLDEHSAKISQIKTDAQLNADIVNAVTPSIISMLRRNSTTGALFVLDGQGVQGDETSYAGVYLRDLDPTSMAQGNRDLLVERGLPSLARNSNLSLDSYWSSVFNLKVDDGKSKFFFMPVNAAKNGEEKNAANYAYWSAAFEPNGKQDLSVVTYTQPLIYTDGTVYGAVGIDLTVNYLESLLDYKSLSASSNCAYAIAVTDSNYKTFNIIAQSGPAGQLYFGNNTTINSKDYDYEGIIELSHKKHSSTTVLASVSEYNIYANNAPFENDRWVLMGICPEKDLLSFYERMSYVMMLAAAISLALSLFAIYYASRRVTRPVEDLVDELENSDPNKPLSLEKINIREIDKLTESVESLSKSVADASSKISDTINKSGIDIGVFRFRDDSETVFCSKSLFRIMGWNVPDTEYIYLARSEFKTLFAKRGIVNLIGNETNNVYKLPGESKARWIKISYNNNDGEILGTVIDTTRDMEEKLKIEYERDYDVLTDIYNRRAFKTKIEKLFENPEQLGVSAMMMVDLDNLKYLNDNYGHDMGDSYIKEIAHGLMEYQKYNAIVARRSGDEFYVFIYGYKSKREVRNIIGEVWTTVQKHSIKLPNGDEYRVRASGGISWYPEDANTLSNLIHYADFAMYSIKRSVKGKLKDFDKAMYRSNAILINGQEALNKILDNEFVEYAFQPIVSAVDCSVYGYEMLMRPQSEILRSPLEVIRLASDQSKLYEIERITWFKAFRTFVNAIKFGTVGNTEKIFLNSISNQVLDKKDMKAFETEFGDYLDRLMLELTESEPNDDTYTQIKLDKLDEWNSHLALDDYGSGYNSEAKLVSLSPDLVKIDISLVHNVNKDKNKQSLLANLIDYARKYGIAILAEGVETKEEMECLVNLGVSYFQGFYIARPSRFPEAIERRIKNTIIRAHARSESEKREKTKQ